jgi:glycosyltransferase involved in cell wall biosynthesis
MTTRVAINGLATTLLPSGGRTYLLNLVDELTTVAGDDYRFYLLCSAHNAGVFAERELSARVQLVIFPAIFASPYLRVFLEQFWLPLWLKLRNIDLLFASRNIMPLLAPCKSVIGVHSMHLNYQGIPLPGWRRRLAHLLLKASGQRADAIVAVSHYAGATYIEQYQLPGTKLFVAPNGLDRAMSACDTPTEPLVGGEYLLFVSTLFPHKNPEFLIRVFSELVETRPTTKLVVVGRDPQGLLPGLREQVEQLGLSERVQFMGTVSDETLRQLYTHARAFVFPSLLEGFGLPVLEAMAHGVPVVASNRTSLPEVVGDGGIVLEPEDEREWARTIARLLDDEGLRYVMGQRAERRAGQYTWARTARRVLDCFDVVLNRPQMLT